MLPPPPSRMFLLAMKTCLVVINQFISEVADSPKSLLQFYCATEEKHGIKELNKSNGPVKKLKQAKKLKIAAQTSPLIDTDQLKGTVAEIIQQTCDMDFDCRY